MHMGSRKDQHGELVVYGKFENERVVVEIPKNGGDVKLFSEHFKLELLVEGCRKDTPNAEAGKK